MKRNFILQEKQDLQKQIRISVPKQTEKSTKSSINLYKEYAQQMGIAEDPCQLETKYLIYHLFNLELPKNSAVQIVSQITEEKKEKLDEQIHNLVQSSIEITDQDQEEKPKRKRSKRHYHCSRCGRDGHNKNKCFPQDAKYVISAFTYLEEHEYFASYEKVQIWSDGEYNFFVSHHECSGCDGHFGNIKQLETRLKLKGEKKYSPQEYVEMFNNMKNTLAIHKHITETITLKNIRKYHQFLFTRKGEVHVRLLSSTGKYRKRKIRKKY
ncbi:hypothetical protein M0811_08449 [Anaeramoeba ignava]|uniref:CCHC-type domain-containing protein n=1 Tax=Anaeramoeba ignava TaxID=1746090 RepID=A0A9Q0LIT9_ANAIG|nr:hypothetical protein M0811_08449 [Anaeramoeba ignava]